MTQQNLFGEPPAQATNGQDARKLGQPLLHTWFFALRPAIEDARRIRTFAEKLLSSHGVSGKRIDPERLHITLELVGHDVDDALVDASCRAADAVSFPVMEARFEAAMTFAGPSGPLVLLGGKGLDEVRGLRTALGCAMADRGFAPPRAYEPHMTLCYDEKHRLARTPIEPISFHVCDFALVKSHIGFSRHEVLRTWRLDR